MFVAQVRRRVPRGQRAFTEPGPNPHNTLPSPRCVNSQISHGCRHVVLIERFHAEQTSTGDILIRRCRNVLHGRSVPTNGFSCPDLPTRSGTGFPETSVFVARVTLNVLLIVGVACVGFVATAWWAFAF